MKLSEVKSALKNVEKMAFQLPNGDLVPSHFHVTEIGLVSKHFIDCGGTVRRENVINFQLWSANDYNHRLHPEKLVDIIQLSERTLALEDLEIEVEYQGTTIEKYSLNFDGTNFLLTTKETDCLAPEKCGIPAEKPKVNLAELNTPDACTPGGGCC